MRDSNDIASHRFLRQRLHWPCVVPVGSIEAGLESDDPKAMCPDPRVNYRLLIRCRAYDPSLTSTFAACRSPFLGCEHRGAIDASKSFLPGFSKSDGLPCRSQGFGSSSAVFKTSLSALLVESPTQPDSNDSLREYTKESCF